MCPLARHVIVVRTVGMETRAEGLWAREAWSSVAVLPRVIRRMGFVACCAMRPVPHEDEGPLWNAPDKGMRWPLQAAC